MLEWLNVLQTVPAQARGAAPIASPALRLAGGTLAHDGLPWLRGALARIGLCPGGRGGPAHLSLLAPTSAALQREGMHPGQMSQDALGLWLLRHLTLAPLDDGASPLQMLDGTLLRPAGRAGQWLDAQGQTVRSLGPRRPARRQHGLAVQPIDRVLAPASPTLWERIASQPGLQRFATALQDTGVAAWLRSAGPFTVFAPADDTAPPAHLSRAELADWLSHHVLPGRWPSAALPWGGQLRMASGRSLDFSPLGLVGLGGQAQAQALGPGSDQPCRNGLLHRLDGAPFPFRPDAGPAATTARDAVPVVLPSRCN